jgi:hypothetical protein
MRLIQQCRREAIGPQVSRDPDLLVARAGTGSMGVSQGLRDRAALFSDSDQVDVVAHQTVSPDQHAELLGETVEQADVGSAIVVGAKQAFAVIAAVCEVKRPGFQHDPCESRHLGRVVA